MAESGSLDQLRRFTMLLVLIGLTVITLVAYVLVTSMVHWWSGELDMRWPIWVQVVAILLNLGATLQLLLIVRNTSISVWAIAFCLPILPAVALLYMMASNKASVEYSRSRRLQSDFIDMREVARRTEKRYKILMLVWGFLTVILVGYLISTV